MTIFYKLEDKLYVNITNKCSCSCVFCIRKNADGVGDAQSLWLEREPDSGEIKAAFDACKLDGMTEIVFCGYGEPMERADTVMEICGYIKTVSVLPVRINTNGLVKLINPGFEVNRLAIADTVSISLNADDSDEYLRVTQSRFGKESFGALLDFAAEAKRYTNVQFTIVDLLGTERISNCVKIAEKLGIPLRIRKQITDNRYPDNA